MWFWGDIKKLKQENELQLIELQKIYNKKLENLNAGRPLIQDLLKKIAYLEGIKEAKIHRRTTEDVIHKLSIINEQMLKNEREEKNIESLKEQVYLLKWILGEE